LKASKIIGFYLRHYVALAVWSIEVDVVEMATQAMVLGFYVKSHGHI
jgi:hypothetical protein